MGRFPVVWNVETAQRINTEGALAVLIGCFVLFTLISLALQYFTKGDDHDQRG